MKCTTLLLIYYIIFISDPTFTKCFSSVYKTCKANEITPRIEIKSKKYIDCERVCIEDSNCKFVFFIPAQGLCLKYPSCHLTRKPSNIGSTYSKDGNCQGERHAKDHYYVKSFYIFY